MTPLINGRAFDFAQIIVNINGVPIPSVSSVTYTEEQTKENNFGAGKRPISRGHGTINASASIEMSMNDVERLRDEAPNGSLLALPAFDILVVFGNPQQPTKHRLKNCEFLSDGVETSLDDTDVKRSFDLVVSDIQFR